MPPVIAPNGALRLPVGQVTVLLGPAPVRGRVTALLDEGSTRCADGHRSSAVRLQAQGGAAQRLRAVEAAAQVRPPLVLVDRFTDGLSADDLGDVLAAVRRLAASGVAVLVDDTDPVAALASADVALRVAADGSLSVDSLLPEV